MVTTDQTPGLCYWAPNIYIFIFLFANPVLLLLCCDETKMIINAAVSLVDLTGQTKDKGRGQSSPGGGLSCPGLAGLEGTFQTGAL